MTVLENGITIRADPFTICRFAAQVERWPEILPHYQSVTVINPRSPDYHLRMTAWRGWLPVTWLTSFSWDPSIPVMRFRHVGGLTTGMYVEWNFHPIPGSEQTSVAITHDLTPIKGMRRQLLEYVIGPYFVDYIAGRTLKYMKAHIEADSAATQMTDSKG